MQKLEEINASQEKKESKCKFCKRPVVFKAVDIVTDPFSKQERIKWSCQTPKGENHSALCLGDPEYTPRFTKGETILSQWKEHATMYIIGAVDEDEGFYELIYQKKRHYRNRIPIKTIDKKSSRCDGAGEANAAALLPAKALQVAKESGIPEIWDYNPDNRKYGFNYLDRNWVEANYVSASELAKAVYE